VISAALDIGVSDEEPGAFGNIALGATGSWAGGGQHDPIATGTYTFLGNDRGVDDLQALTHSTVFQQVHGFIASSNLGLTDLPKAQLALVFNGSVNNWNKVYKADGSTVTTASAPIIICNREVGSGSRVAADLFLNATGCNIPGGTGTYAVTSVGGGALLGVTTPIQPLENLQTGAELDCVNRVGGNAIGYASIDNLTSSKIGGTTSFPNVVALSVDGVAPTLANAALGRYQNVWETSWNQAPGLIGIAKAFYDAATPVLQTAATSSTSAQVLAIPGQPVGQSFVWPLATTTTPVAAFSRGGGNGNSCNGLERF
jgi:ABC-type phosphate transport system substrate-binding protein